MIASPTMANRRATEDDGPREPFNPFEVKSIEEAGGRDHRTLVDVCLSISRAHRLHFNRSHQIATLTRILDCTTKSVEIWLEWARHHCST